MIADRPCVWGHWRNLRNGAKNCTHLCRTLSRHFIASLWLFGAITGTAQQAVADGDCDATLSALNWILVDDAYSALSWDRSGAVLSGMACSETTIIDWFKASDWRLSKAVDFSGDRYGSGDASYRADRGLVFCLPRTWFARWRTGGCSASASVLMFEGKITWATAGPTK